MQKRRLVDRYVRGLMHRSRREGGSRGEGVGFKVQGLGSRVKDLGFRV